jgi:hypothetical protein
VQRFYGQYFVEYFGVKYSLEYDTPYLYKIETKDGVQKTKKIQNNQLIRVGATYNNETDIMSYYASNVFDNYADGRRIAELEWIGSPDVRIRDRIRVVPKYGDYIEKWVAPYTSFISFVGTDVSKNKKFSVIVEGLKANTRTRLIVQFSFNATGLINRTTKAVELPATLTIFSSGTTVTIYEPTEDNTLVFEYSELDAANVSISGIQQIDSGNSVLYTVMGKEHKFNGGYSEKLYLVEEDKSKTKEEKIPTVYPKYAAILQETRLNGDVSLATGGAADKQMFLDYEITSDGKFKGKNNIGMTDIKAGTVFYRDSTIGFNKYEALSSVTDLKEDGLLKANLYIYSLGINEIYEE